ncbi:hypothetical protein NXS08_03015 [Gleimia sp. 6138-11-ORH1]|uniref:hypothetical protein n=1 Tax=Gleimia sp. 6138-11-ORH1 TaxID=2973937 RepID=UPI002168B853|nr:hypothetical protein [Gleimia sp. 6138-11-ORH1]MCS4484459.1 hypothetical protein [Gleimia sp. 6138-11-ORH1]
MNQPRREQAGMYAPRGWLSKQGITQLLQPYLTYPHDTQLDFAKSLPTPFRDYEPFGGISGKTAQELLNKLPAKNLTDRQNNAPLCAELLTLASENHQEIELFGYAIGAQRFDERISIEGFIYYPQIPHLTERFIKPGAEESLFEEIANRLGIKSYLAPPDELHYLRPYWNPGRSGWWAWWD